MTLTQRIQGNERRYIEEVLQSDFRSSKGAGMMGKLEKAFAERFGSTYAISFVNGTATMHAALEAKGIGPGDAAVIFCLMLGHHRMNIRTDVADLPRAEILIAAVVVEGDHRRKLALGSSGLEDDRFGGGTVRELPREMLDIESVELERVLDFGFRGTTGVGRE